MALSASKLCLDAPVRASVQRVLMLGQSVSLAYSLPTNLALSDRSLGEIHQALESRGVSISERRVTDYMGEYEVLLKCAQGAKLEAYREQILANGGVVLALTGYSRRKVNRHCISSETH